MTVKLLKKNLTLVFTALFLAIGLISIKAQTITNVAISGPACAGSTVTVTFNAASANGTPRQFTNKTVFKPFISTIGGGGPYTALPTFTVSSLPSDGINDQIFTGLTAQISIPLTQAPGTYRISLGSGNTGSTLADYPYIIGNQTSPNASIISKELFTVNAPPIGGTITPSSSMVCSGQTSGLLTLTGNTGNVLRWERSTDNVTFTTAANTNTTTTFTSGPLTQTTYYRAIVTNGVCEAPSKVSVITVGATSTYTAGKWSNGLPNNNGLNAVIESTYSTSTAGSINACNCEVKSGIALTVNPGTYVEVQNNILNNGSITVESDGNLVQRTGSYSGSGTFTAKRNASMRRLDYTYWGSPVSGQNLKAFSPGTVNNRFYTYNEFNDFFEIIDPLTNVFGNNRLGAFESDAKGYTIRANNAYPAWTDPATAVYTTFEGIFKGTPHNGNITFPLQYAGGGHNLVGNPYASNIDFHALAAAGTIEGVAYFWTNANPTPATQEGSGYAGTNYSVYTVLSGGTPALNAGADKKPERFIKVGQGFIVKAKAAGPLTFNNAMRDNGTGGPSTFINKTAAAKSEVIDRFWLRLTTPAKNFNTILIAYPKGATNGFESNADAKQLTGSSDEFYSVQNGTKLIIQGRQFPVQNTDKVALGMKNHQAGTYTVSLSEKEGVFVNGQAVYLKDSQTGIITNLSESHYTFTAEAGVSDNRFELSYQPQAKVLATDTVTKETVEVYKDGKAFVIRSAGKKITGLEVFDATGKLIISSAPQQTEARVEAGSWPKGSYILKITRNGEVTTRKVLN